MSAFVDEIRFKVLSGDGGAGSTSFRREKYVPRGGPDGGDGGKGGDVVFVTKRNLSTLQHLRGKSILKASFGEDGRGRRMHGKNGEDQVIEVPPGTRIMDADTRELLHDFSKDIEGEHWICLNGGNGGQGNWHFRTSRNQAPQFAQDGQCGSTRALELELAVIADIGLVGLPSAGKSSLINAITASRSRIADYPFTTLVPHLGVLRRGETECVIADIPGLIAGASEGAGLGFQFLRHIGRTQSLAFLADLGEDNPSGAIASLEKELRAYDENFLSKKRIIIGSKSDLDENGEKRRALMEAFPHDTVSCISVFTREGLKDLVNILLELNGKDR